MDDVSARTVVATKHAVATMANTHRRINKLERDKIIVQELSFRSETVFPKFMRFNDKSILILSGLVPAHALL